MHVFLYFRTVCLVVLQLILASKLCEQFENQVANCQFSSKDEFSGKGLHPRAKCCACHHGDTRPDCGHH